MKTPHLKYKTGVVEGWYYDQLYDHIVRLIVDLPDRPALRQVTALDLGCGRGELLSKMVERGISCVGMDVDPVCVKLASRYAPCVVGDISRVAEQLHGKKYDVVVGSHVLEHMPAPAQAVQQMKFVSKRWLILAVPNLSALNVVVGEMYRYWTNGSVNPAHVCGWNYSHFKAFLENHVGLNIVRFARDPVLLPMLPMMHALTYRLLEPLYRLLACPFPTLGSSLLVLCEIPGDYDQNA